MIDEGGLCILKRNVRNLKGEKSISFTINKWKTRVKDEKLNEFVQV